MCLSENGAAGKIPKLFSCFFKKKKVFLSFDCICVYEFVHEGSAHGGAGVRGGFRLPDTVPGFSAKSRKRS